MQKQNEENEKFTVEIETSIEKGFVKKMIDLFNEQTSKKGDEIVGELQRSAYGLYYQNIAKADHITNEIYRSTCSVHEHNKQTGNQILREVHRYSSQLYEQNKEKTNQIIHEVNRSSYGINQHLQNQTYGINQHLQNQTYGINKQFQNQTRNITNKIETGTKNILKETSSIKEELEQAKNIFEKSQKFRELDYKSISDHLDKNSREAQEYSKNVINSLREFDKKLSAIEPIRSKTIFLEKETQTPIKEFSEKWTNIHSSIIKEKIENNSSENESSSKFMFKKILFLKKILNQNKKNLEKVDEISLKQKIQETENWNLTTSEWQFLEDTRNLKLLNLNEANSSKLRKDIEFIKNQQKVWNEEENLFNKLYLDSPIKLSDLTKLFDKLLDCFKSKNTTYNQFSEEFIYMLSDYSKSSKEFEDANLPFINYLGGSAILDSIKNNEKACLFFSNFLKDFLRKKYTDFYAKIGVNLNEIETLYFSEELNNPILEQSEEKQNELLNRKIVDLTMLLSDTRKKFKNIKKSVFTNEFLESFSQFAEKTLEIGRDFLEILGNLEDDI